jgi:hypothetical protein
LLSLSAWLPPANQAGEAEASLSSLFTRLTGYMKAECQHLSGQSGSLPDCVKQTGLFTLHFLHFSLSLLSIHFSDFHHDDQN